jgi:hypothetical protein
LAARLNREEITIGYPFSSRGTFSEFPNGYVMIESEPLMPIVQKGWVNMGDKGKRDKGKRETKKKPKLTIKEKRKLKKEKRLTDS